MTSEKDIRANVLYVDDMQTNLILFQATFEKDYNIITCESANKALEVLKSQEIQVLITDQRMPEMTGTELLGIVAREFPEIRRFLLTAYTDFETVIEAVNKGHIHGYINKPIQAEEVRTTINNSLEVYYLREKNKRIMKELELANNELINLEEVRTEVLKMITREIRSPLNRIMGTIHMLKDKIESDELVEVVNILDSSVNWLERFSSMAEQISVLKSKQDELKKEKISLKQLIDYTLVETAEGIREKGVEVNVEQQEDGTIDGDFDLLISCLSNLLDHALKHSVSGDAITVIAGRMNDFPVCELRFSGKDYPAGQLEELSGHYSRSGKKMNLRLGIELALSQLIMESHHGNIQFDTGEGDVVSLKLVFRGSEEQ